MSNKITHFLVLEGQEKVGKTTLIKCMKYLNDNRCLLESKDPSKVAFLKFPSEKALEKVEPLHKVYNRLIAKLNRDSFKAYSDESSFIIQEYKYNIAYYLKKIMDIMLEDIINTMNSYIHKDYELVVMDRGFISTFLYQFLSWNYFMTSSSSSIIYDYVDDMTTKFNLFIEYITTNFPIINAYKDHFNILGNTIHHVFLMNNASVETLDLDCDREKEESKFKSDKDSDTSLASRLKKQLEEIRKVDEENHMVGDSNRKVGISDIRYSYFKFIDIFNIDSDGKFKRKKVETIMNEIIYSGNSLSFIPFLRLYDKDNDSNYNEK